MNALRLTAAVAAVVLSSLNANATTGEQSYAVEGPGRMGCSAFTALAPDDRRNGAVLLWLTGYLTAHHKLLGDVFDLSPWQTPEVLLSLVRQYCSAHQDAIVEQGARELVLFLGPDAERTESKVVEWRNGDDLVLLYETTVQKIRDALSVAGHSPGETSDDLVSALSAYQASNGIAVTGLPDQATMLKLFWH